MIVIDKFTLLKNVFNVLKLSQSEIAAREIENSSTILYANLHINARKINHFSKDYIFNQLKDPKKRNKFKVVVFSDYLLPVTYNKPSKEIIINLSSFNTDDLAQVDPRNLYSCLVYGICFESLILGNSKIPDAYANVIINYLLAMFIRLFGKEFGLVGVYATEIPKLKFLISCYIYVSFFGLSNSNDVYRKSSLISGFDFRPEQDKIDRINFSKIDEFIKALSSLNVMPGINRYQFTAKFLKFFGVNFLPALEDLSRFISTLTASTVGGSTVVPKFIYTYNETEFNRIIDLSKRIFR